MVPAALPWYELWSDQDGELDGLRAGVGEEDDLQ
jgi:hypothetical protein